MSAEEQSNDARRLVLGLTGPFGSGCSEVARTLEKERGYCVIRVSNILADEARNGGTELPDAAEERRGVLQQLGNDLRKEEGLDILVRKALESLTTEECSGPIVVDSIKNPGEIDKLKELPNAYVIAVDASREKRWARIAEQSQYDQKRFLRNDEIDRDEGIEYGQKVQACVDRADIIVANEEDWHNSVRKKSLFDYKVLQYIKLLERPGYREPSVSELVMQHAYATSLRSRCLSRRVGAVIVLQENPNGPFYVLATGYNHAPLGSYECTEEWGRCYRAKRKAEVSDKFRFCPGCGRELTLGRCGKKDCELSEVQGDLIDHLTPGRRLDVCPAVHAEESAILQTSLLGGPSPQGGIMLTTTFPCPLCAKMIVETGIREVAYIEAYPMPESLEILRNAGVELTRFEGVKAQAFVPLFAGHKQVVP